MPIYSNGAFSQGYSQNDLEADPAAVRKATFQQALSDLPGWSIVRSEELQVARKYGELAGFKRYTSEGATEYMKEQGLDGFQFDRDYNGDELRILASRKRAELKRQDVLSRADNSLSAQAGRLGIQLASSLLDPLAVGTAFVPVIGPSRYAGMLAKASTPLARAGVRAGVGAAEGAVGAAIVEPIIYAAKSYEQADYTLADSMLNIGVGSIFGGGLHTIGGAIGDVVAAPRRAQAAKRVAEIKRLLDQQEELNAPAPFTALEAVERRLSVADVEQNMEGLYAARKAELESAIKDTGEPGVLGISRKEAAESELKRLESAWNRAKDPQDRARIMAGEDGPLWRSLVDAERADTLAATEARITELEAQRPALEAAMQEPEATGALAETLNADREGRIRDANRNLRKIDGELLRLKPLAETLSTQLQDLPKITVLRAAPETREAALRTAVGQAASDSPIEARPFFDPATRRAAADRVADPDQRPLVEPEHVVRADQIIAQGDQAELAQIQKQSQELDAQFAAMKAEAKLTEDTQAQNTLETLEEGLAELTASSTDATKQAQMLVLCAMRHAA